ncbi:MAG: ribose 5-phosphate isomerase B [Deltaproteobacteria bacterium RBG_13_49_15]|nr:MAG: ribose 5-phosphate isomerase B [Deltaproteobacteria bacterium RBG_13_49_15]
MSIAIGSDHNGFELKEEIKAYLKTLGKEVEDYGVASEDPVDYPDIAVKLAEAVAQGKHNRGILVCGTGIGMAIAANKVPGVYAATCHDSFSTERARKSNNAQIMTMGAQVIGPELAKSLVNIWLESEFQGGRSQPKVDKIRKIEEKYTRK